MLEEKAKKFSSDEIKMIEKYDRKIYELEVEYKDKISELERKEKEFWKKELEVKSKKR